jgi:hypothetical protein
MAGMPVPDKGDKQEHDPRKNPAPLAFAAPHDRINHAKPLQRTCEVYTQLHTACPVTRRWRRITNGNASCPGKSEEKASFLKKEAKNFYYAGP